MKRAACGIAFLGDFWHARGSLKVTIVIANNHTINQSSIGPAALDGTT